MLGIDPQELFIEIFDQIEENSGKMNLEMITDRLATMACKAAVKGNTAMSYQEMDALMDQLMKLDNPYQCPHGRPTIISMTKYELEKSLSEYSRGDGCGTEKPLIILTGPTAAGKTKLSIGLAKSIGGEIISADSMQVYKNDGYRYSKDSSEEMDRSAALSGR